MSITSKRDRSLYRSNSSKGDADVLTNRFGLSSLTVGSTCSIESAFPTCSIVYCPFRSLATRPMSLLARSGAVLTVTSLQVVSDIVY